MSKKMYQNPTLLMKHSICTYPTLYETKLRVLDHLFAVVGNGYDWTDDGYLVSYENKHKTEKEALKTIEDAKKHAEDVLNGNFDFVKSLDGVWLHTYNRAKFEGDEGMMKVMVRLEKESQEKCTKQIINCEQIIEASLVEENAELLKYPLSGDYSKILNFPDNVALEWIPYMKEFISFVLNQYDSENEKNMLKKAMMRIESIEKMRGV